jgi:hypothetical protein
VWKEFRPKIITRDKEGQSLLIKRAINQEYMIVNIYALNIGAPNFIK